MEERYFYSPTRGGFYPLSMKEQYENSINGWPADAVEISPGDYQALMAGQENGQEIVPGDDGMPELVTPEIDLVAETGAKIRTLLKEAAEIIFPLTLAVKHGIATEDETASLEAWEKYSVLVNRVKPGEDLPLKPE